MKKNRGVMLQLFTAFTAMPMSIFAAEEFHDIAPPVDYSLIPPWLIFVGVFVSLTVIATPGADSIAAPPRPGNTRADAARD